MRSPSKIGPTRSAILALTLLFGLLCALVSAPVASATTTDTVTVTGQSDSQWIKGDYVVDPYSASGGTGPYYWSASGLPSGVSMDPYSGVISGTVTQSGSYTVTVTAVATAGGSGTFTANWFIWGRTCSLC